MSVNVVVIIGMYRLLVYFVLLMNFMLLYIIKKLC